MFFNICILIHVLLCCTRKNWWGMGYSMLPFLLLWDVCGGLCLHAWNLCARHWWWWPRRQEACGTVAKYPTSSLMKWLTYSTLWGIVDNWEQCLTEAEIKKKKKDLQDRGPLSGGWMCNDKSSFSVKCSSMEYSRHSWIGFFRLHLRWHWSNRPLHRGWLLPPQSLNVWCPTGSSLVNFRWRASAVRLLQLVVSWTTNYLKDYTISISTLEKPSVVFQIDFYLKVSFHQTSIERQHVWTQGSWHGVRHSLVYWQLLHIVC